MLLRRPRMLHQPPTRTTATFCLISMKGIGLLLLRLHTCDLHFEAKMKCKEAISELMIPKQKQINWFIPPNQTEEELKESILKENYTIGKPVPGFDVYQSVCYTHNYMKKISSGPGAKALCLVCLISPEKKIVFLKCTDNSTKGKKVINF